MRVVLFLVMLACPAFAQDPSAMIQIQGGGFIFNYRISEAFYGFVLKPQRALPTGTLIEAAFENPAGGEPIVVREAYSGSPKTISFRTPPVTGVKAGKDYQVVIRLKEPASNVVIAELSKSFRSDVDQDVLPSRPLTIGPGYHPNPEGGAPR